MPLLIADIMGWIGGALLSLAPIWLGIKWAVEQWRAAKREKQERIDKIEQLQREADERTQLQIKQNRKDAIDELWRLLEEERRITKELSDLLARKDVKIDSIQQECDREHGIKDAEIKSLNAELKQSQISIVRLEAKLERCQCPTNRGNSES